MPPPLHSVPVSNLEEEVNRLPSGKRRKMQIDVRECALRELTQYKCNIFRPKRKGGDPEIICEPVVRLFRVCKEGLTVETTAWETWRKKQDGEKGVAKKG